MCNPALVMVAATVIGTGVSVYSQVQQGKTAETFANYEAEQGRADAQAERGAAQVEADRIRRAGAQAVAETNAALAGSGQNLASAGALGLNRAVYRGAEEDAAFALLGGRDRATALNTQASLTQARGKAAKQGATLSAFGTAVQGAATAYSGYRSAKKA